MRSLVYVGVAGAICSSIGAALPSSLAVPISPPTEGAWTSGAYRNLFVESGAHTEEEVTARLDQIYQQVFFGDDDDER